MSGRKYEITARPQQPTAGLQETREAGTYGTDRLDWAPGLELDEAYRLLPEKARTSVEETAGAPIYTWFADAREQCHFAAIGPAGFATIWGPRTQKGWSVTRLRRPIRVEQSRWFTESALSPRPPSRRHTAPGAAQAGGPFDEFGPLFTETFGLLTTES